MKKRIALLLCLVMVLSMFLCSCKKEEAPSAVDVAATPAATEPVVTEPPTTLPPPPTDEELIVGTWKSVFDFGPMLNKELEAVGITEFLTLDKFDIVYIMTFNADGTYTMALDETALEAETDAFMDQLVDATLVMMQAMLAEEGVEMEMEDMMTLLGVSKEDLKAEMEADMDITQMVEDVNIAGKYKLDDGKLYASKTLEEEIDMSVYETYAFGADTLTIDKGNGADAEGDFAYPMVFDKAA